MVVPHTSYLPTNIRHLRKRKEMSQDELAQSIGLNRGNIASYEKSSAEPKICNLLKMSALFEVSAWDLSSKDLTDETILSQAIDSFRLLGSQQNLDLVQFKEQANQIATYLEGIHQCCHYKTNNFDALPAEAQVLHGFYHQLHEASQKLLQQHLSLISFIECPTK